MAQLTDNNTDNTHAMSRNGGCSQNKAFNDGTAVSDTHVEISLCDTFESWSLRQIF